MRVAFHDNQLCMRGTSVVIYDHAFFSRKYLGIDPIILYKKNHKWNSMDVINNKFKKEFPVYSYDDISNMDYIINRENVDTTFFIKSGQKDGVISKNSKSLINAVAPCKVSDIHGDRFAMGSKWLSKVSDNIPYVPHMVYLPYDDGNMRGLLNIPSDALVVGRNGGYTTFDINFAKQAIKDVIDIRSDLYFLFQCTEKFIEHDRVIFLDCSPDLNIKTQFINTCDVMLHARDLGESFGLSCAEFSIMNKRIITWSGSVERNHIETLGDKGIYFDDYLTLKTILQDITKNDLIGYWNCYKYYNPENVMKIFKKIYLD